MMTERFGLPFARLHREAVSGVMKPVSRASRIRERRSYLLFAGFLWSSPAVSAEPNIWIERAQDEIRIEASLEVPAHDHIAWQVLTDYNNLAAFVPGMRSSEIVSAPGEPLLLKQTGQSGFLLLSLPVDVVTRIVETPLERIQFYAVGGSLKSKSGEWRIEPRGDATVMIYRASIVPGFWVPPLIGAAVIGQDVRRKLAGVGQEILRRSALVAGKDD